MMKKVAFVFLIATLTAGQASGAWNPFKDIEKAAQEVGKAVERAGQEVGKGIEHVGQEVGKATGIKVPKDLEKAARDAGKGAEITVRRAGRDVEREVRNGGKAVADGLEHFGGEVENTAHAVGDGVEHFFQEFEKEFCNLMTAGAYKRGEAGCSINVGVAVDNEGNVEGQDPQTGQTYPGRSTSDETSEQPAMTVEQFAEMLEEPLPTYEEFVVDGFTTQDRFDPMVRFLPGTQRLGNPMPVGGIVPPTQSGLVRGTGGGGGHFLAVRKDGNGNRRYHGGVDYLTMPGETIYSPVSGKVSHIVTAMFPGDKRGLKGVAIRTDDGYTVKVLYVSAGHEMKKGTVVKAGESLGQAQDLRPAYGPKMANHVHVTVEDPSGNRVDPTGRRVLRKRNK